MTSTDTKNLPESDHTDCPSDWHCPQCDEHLDSMGDCSCGFVWKQGKSMTEKEHLRYHLEVSLTGCGVPDCEWTDGLALHFQALKELPEAQPSEQQKDWLPEDEDSDL